MKRTVKCLVLALVVAALLAVSAFAADFTHCADALKDLGLFQGTSKGYDLDRAPTRTEAGVMLVRLLGQEEAALANETYTAPFTDVQDWAKPYVQYLYDNGLTNGKSATLFGYSDKCTAQQYATFLLRALGYSDAEGGDFAYADALDFAREKGVVDAANCDEQNFLRDDVVAMSYTALATAPKSGEVDLLTKLVKDGAIADAKGYDELFEMYREYSAAAGATQAEDKASMTMAVSISAKLAGVNFMSGSMKLDMAMDLDEEAMDQSKMAMTGTLDLAIDPAIAAQAGLTEEEAQIKSDINYYYTDGYYYVSAADQKLKMPLSFEEAMGQMESLASTGSSVEPICLLKDITSSGTSSNRTYSLTYSGSAMTGLMESVMEMLPTDITGTSVPTMKMDDMVIAVSVSNGAMTGMGTTMNVETTVEGQTMSIAMEMKINNIKTGNSVTVNLPTDLDTYQEIIGGNIA